VYTPGYQRPEVAQQLDPGWPARVRLLTS